MTVLISLLLVLIAATGAWIALQQMLIARTKLNHDLFDKRFAIYKATRNYMNIMLRDKGGTQEDAVKWFEIASGAPFLFDDELVKYIKEIELHGQNIRATVGGKPLYEVKEQVAVYNENYMWIGQNFGVLEEKFKPSLSLLKLKPFSISSILP